MPHETTGFSKYAIDFFVGLLYYVNIYKDSGNGGNHEKKAEKTVEKNEKKHVLIWCNKYIRKKVKLIIRDMVKLKENIKQLRD